MMIACYFHRHLVLRGLRTGNPDVESNNRQLHAFQNRYLFVPQIFS